MLHKHHKIQVVHGPVPSTAAYALAPVHVLVAPRGELDNFGLAVYNVLVPVFNLMAWFDLYTPDVQVVWHTYGEGMVALR